MDPHVVRRLLASRQMGPMAFRAALDSFPQAEGDGWLDRIFELRALPLDGPELPRGCVPYLPCPVEPLLRIIELADIQSSDVFVDIGSGLGRALLLTHFLTGAEALGIEIQSALVRRSCELAASLNAERVSVTEGDAVALAHTLAIGSVFFLYCPFSGSRLDRVLAAIAALAKTRSVRVCSVDLPLPPCPWLAPVSLSDDIAVYRSRPGAGQAEPRTCLR